jgi:putative ATPase
MSQSLFSGGAPLAARMRPRTLEEVIGQEKALLSGSPLQILAKAESANSSHTSILIWGPPGTGKTSIAKAVASSSGRRFVELSAVSTGVKELRDVIEKARLDQETYGVKRSCFLMKFIDSPKRNRTLCCRLLKAVAFCSSQLPLRIPRLP